MRKLKEMKKFWLLSLIISIVIWKSYGQPEIGSMQLTAKLRATLSTPGGELPFILIVNTTLPHPEFGTTETKVAGEILNGNEVINFEIKNTEPEDSLRIQLPVFNTELVIKLSDKSGDGYWYDHSRPGNYFLPFHMESFAENEKAYRFHKNPLPPKANISGRYDAIFKDESSVDSAVGIFEQDGNHLTGTFLTTTGDYRFLEGDVSADSFFLSTFDGSHAFLFKGKIQDDGTLTCDYWSGKHYHATIAMRRNENAHLPDARSLTHLKDGYTKLDFSFPDENGNTVSLQDEQFANKPVVVLITGSWCPNCMDEASYMSEVEEKYKNTNLKIVALSFERQTGAASFKTNIGRLKAHFGIEYPFLNAGSNKNASAALPMLDHVMGFPTTIILNKQHEVVEIYTGFSGPATGQLFVDYQKEFEHLLDKLLL